MPFGLWAPNQRGGGQGTRVQADTQRAQYAHTSTAEGQGEGEE